MIRKEDIEFLALVLAACGIAYCTGSRAADTTVTCTAPTQNTDGTPVSTITGYRLYKSVDAGALAVHGESQNCTFAVTGLTPGTWHFQAKTLTTADESALSNPATFIVPADTPPPDPNPTPSDNLALNKPTTATSIDGDYGLAKYATDGNATTRWAANRSDFNTQYLTVDLGQHYDLSKAHVSMEQSCAKAYSFDASDDNASWTTLTSITNNSALENDLTLTGGGRYVRLAITDRCNNSFGASVWELQVFGASSTPPPIQPPPPKVVLVNGSYTLKKGTTNVQAGFLTEQLCIAYGVQQAPAGATKYSCAAVGRSFTVVKQ